MKKPTSVQFKFYEDLKNLTDPTEPRMRTVEIPAQDKAQLSRSMSRHRIPTLSLLLIACIAFCTCLVLVMLHR